MQAAVIASLPVSNITSDAGKPSASLTADFETALTAWMSAFAPVPRGEEPDAIKVAPGKDKLKMQPDKPAVEPDEPIAGAATPVPAPALPVQLPAIPLLLAAPQVPLPQSAEEAVTTGAGPVAIAKKAPDSKDVGRVQSGPNTVTSPDLVPVQENLPVQQIASQAEKAPPPDTPEAIVAHVFVPEPSISLPQTASPAASPTASIDNTQPSMVRDQIPAAPVAGVVLGEARGEIRLNLKSDETSPAPAAPFTEVPRLPETLSSQARPPLNSSAGVFHLPPAIQTDPPLSPFADAKFTPANEAAKASHPSEKAENAVAAETNPVSDVKPFSPNDGAKPSQPSAKTENATAEKSIPVPILAPQSSGTEPQPVELAAAESERLGPSVPLPPPQTKGAISTLTQSAAGPLRPIAPNTVSAADAAAQALAQPPADSTTTNKTPPPAGATPESRDDTEKKSPASNQQTTVSPHEAAAAAALAKDPGTPVTVSTEPASAPPNHAPSPEACEVPKTQQLLDAAPPPPVAPPAARLAAEASAEAQMHLGIRTAAFGAVEIYTSVHQNQVGLAVHAEHGMAHWFSTEVQNIESGLKDHHLHLTTVELDGGSTGLQTATGSHHRQPPRNFFAITTSRADAAPASAGEPEPIEAAPGGLTAWLGETHVSIRI